MTLETPAARASHDDGPVGADAPLTRAEYRRRVAARSASGPDAPGAALGEAPAADAVAEPDGPSSAARPSSPGSARHEAPRPGAGDDAGVGPAVEDVFETAARVFAFARETGAAGAGRPAAEPVFEVPPYTTTVPVASPRGRAVRVVRRIAAGSLSLGAMTVVGLLAFSTMVPSSAIANPPSADINAVASPPKKAAEEIQAFVATEAPVAEDLDRPAVYGVISMSEIAVESGVTRFAGTWVNNPAAEVQWPFPVGVPVSAGFGSAEYAAQFGTTHNGADFTPGGGAEIHAVASGTVRIATESGDAYGVTVVIDHVIDGETVSTRYAHMQYGSLQVSPGEVVEVGQVIGKVGSTGKSTGDHLHLEVLLGGTTPTDPIAWIQQHTS